ncbi:MAG TPA: AprI/Inh family metalloprotease inhibitor [Pseudolabrys sp.]|nr:AprI/Inh family metalloprotease inhibitor [Pseudolabrys sp.]
MMRPVFAACAALLLAGCAGGQDILSGASTPAPESMNGRWLLTAPNAPPCGLNFAGSPGALAGTISPEGGCPERFYLSRRWSIGESGLTIGDEDNNMLGALTFSGGQFSGTSASGTPVKLTR